MYKLLENAAAGNGAWMLIPRGEYAFSAYGTFGGSTVSLERRLPSGAALAVGTEATITAAGQCIADLPGGLYRCSVTGGTGQSVTAYLDSAESNT